MRLPFATFHGTRALLLTTAWALLGGSMPLPRASAQGLNFVTRTTKYVVGGEIQGQQMDPWEANWMVRDTMVDGKKIVAITHNTIQTATSATFAETTLLDPITGRALQFFGRDNGRAPGTYSLRLATGRLQGTSQPDGDVAGQLDVALAESSIPSSAVPFVLAARELKEGDSIAIHLFTFQGSTNNVFQYDLSGVASSGSFQRAGAAAPEAVWIITGNGAYPAKYVIAKSDRSVLQVVFPQGSVGTETDTYAGPPRE